VKRREFNGCPQLVLFFFFSFSLIVFFDESMYFLEPPILLGPSDSSEPSKRLLNLVCRTSSDSTSHRSSYDPLAVIRLRSPFLPLTPTEFVVTWLLRLPITFVDGLLIPFLPVFCSLSFPNSNFTVMWFEFTVKMFPWGTSSPSLRSLRSVSFFFSSPRCLRLCSF